MNDFAHKFHELYDRNRAKILDVRSRCEVESGPLYGPYLLAPHDSYWQATVKVAFVGHETNGWETSDCDIPRQMNCYHAFNLGAEYYSTPFWNVIRKLEHRLTGSTYCSAALNINRYDQDQGRPSWPNQQVLSELDFLLLEELQLLAPDIVILFTGPSYEARVERLLGGLRIVVAGHTERQLCEIEVPSLRGRVFRTYHPNFLRRSGLEEGVIEAVVQRVATASRSA
jgi:hypothetical protein